MGVAVNTVSGSTRVIGLLGDPVAHSRSPQIHNAAFAACGLDCVYVPFAVAVAALPAAVAGLRALGLRGANVTVPHKVAAAGLLDELDETAAALGAVNTIVAAEGRLRGFNTDVAGFRRALGEVWQVPDTRRRAQAAGQSVPDAGRGVQAAGQTAPDAGLRTRHGAPEAEAAAPRPRARGVKQPAAAPRALLLGAGGAARAVALALADLGLATTVVNRSFDNAERLVETIVAARPRAELAAAPLAALDAALVGAHDLLVNATSLGLPGTGKVPAALADNVLRGQVVVDLVYGEGPTDFLAAARARGAGTVDGLSMLVWQAAAAFELWTGVPAPVQVMRDAAERT
jgi:shikimate dehydrogenase